MRAWAWVGMGATLVAGLAACGESTAEPVCGRLDRVEVVVPAGAGLGLTDAGEDLLDALARLGGAEAPRALSSGAAPGGAACVVEARVDAGDAELGDEGYRLVREAKGVSVVAATETGASYGLYHLAHDLGVRYLHPEETFFPASAARPEGGLPRDYDGAPVLPDFARRGFHEHTQHPIVLSDFLLRPGRDDFRAHLTNYLRWLQRNRQNTLFFHMLKTVDLDAWVPYAADFNAEADARGIHVGLVIGFVDQQQNAFKMVREDVVDADGQPVPAEQQIRDALDTLLAAGFDHVGLQIGTSEFTKPDEAQVLSWLNLAVDHIWDQHPGVVPFAWIHTTCSLETEAGGKFYHLPLQAHPDLGAFVHTTMFYTLDHPAPVYDCEDFSHQKDFFEAADGQRELVFFPETAWWLGFDNNLPLVLPITGWSREHDIQRVLPAWDVSGHVTFTSGREWTYWQYDHYLTRVTWDRDLTWRAYLDEIAPLYGDAGPAMADALQAFTELQRRHFYEESPLIYFYLAGELPQDEIGEKAGILARRPKLAFTKLVAMSDAEFAAWQAGDLAQLQKMRGEYAQALEGLPDALEGGTPQQTRLYREARVSLDVYVQRIEHAIALYQGAAAAREWAREQREEGEQADEAVRDAALAKAEGFLADAQAISAAVLPKLAAMEADYRYAPELLTRPKPESLTSYPFGYLYETHSGYFWTRRDAQLELLVGQVFGTAAEGWATAPAQVFVGARDAIVMEAPSDPVAAAVLGSFMPRLLFGLLGDPATGVATLVGAQDHNDNDLPDPDGAFELVATHAGDAWTGTTATWTLLVFDGAGAPMGTLDVLDLTVTVATAPGAPATLTSATLDGEIGGPALVQMVVDVGGIDTEGATNLIKQVYGVDASAELPERLPVRFTVPLTPAP